MALVAIFIVTQPLKSHYSEAGRKGRVPLLVAKCAQHKEARYIKKKKSGLLNHFDLIIIKCSVCLDN